MKELTKAEEQIMQYLWKLEKAFLKDIIEEFPQPRPAYTTISTVVRVLVKKGFIGFETFGKVNQYYPLVSKKVYTRDFMKGMIKSFFNDSVGGFTSFFAKEQDLSLSQLEEMKSLIEEQIKSKKEND
ncbi:MULTISPECIES: BlaI/MecI/CopY family transcriptional regulator [Marinifilum]|uniref:Putative transcriptional regulator n=1 Tax=Marinifilum flexuosum TaxID=1117708 RepID=A0A419WKW0_9BACT|nr:MULTISPECIES: BlaI/MecI/CopY family transcriptional regulator [Marinifilum]MCY1636534.1 BlaI/MecI/CopY family transcriptional regulator [Marinifilum sp. D737]RKD96110.1 putative transcriptional regulator [Marinifilum flexuosum]